MPKNERRSIKEGEKKEKNLINQGITVIYIKKKRIPIEPVK